MKEKNDYNANRKRLAAQLIAEPPKTPIQEVRPVEPVSTTKADDTTAKKDMHLNFWVDEQLMQRLKIHAVTNRKTIKQIGIQALEDYLNKHE